MSAWKTSKQKIKKRLWSVVKVLFSYAVAVEPSTDDPVHAKRFYRLSLGAALGLVCVSQDCVNVALRCWCTYCWWVWDKNKKTKRQWPRLLFFFLHVLCMTFFISERKWTRLVQRFYICTQAMNTQFCFVFYKMILMGGHAQVVI